MINFCYLNVSLLKLKYKTNLRKMGKQQKVVQQGQQLEQDLSTQIWFDKGPDRTEKNVFLTLFNRMKASMFCNLNRDTHIFQRFKLILQQMEAEYPKYSILEGGESYKTTQVYQRLWRYHNTLVVRWKIDSSKK